MMFFVHVGFLLIPACLCRAFGVMFHVSSIFETFPCCLTAAGLTWNIFTHLYTSLHIWLLRQDVADIFDWGPLEPRGSFFHILPHSSTFFHILPHSSTFFHILPQHVCLHSCLQCLVLFSAGYLMISVGFQGNAAVSNAAAEAAEPAVAPAAHAEAPEQARGSGAEWCWQVWKDEGCWTMLLDVECMEPTKVRMLLGTLWQKWDCIV